MSTNTTSRGIITLKLGTIKPSAHVGSDGAPWWAQLGCRGIEAITFPAEVGIGEDFDPDTIDTQPSNKGDGSFRAMILTDRTSAGGTFAVILSKLRLDQDEESSDGTRTVKLEANINVRQTQSEAGDMGKWELVDP